MTISHLIGLALTIVVTAVSGLVTSACAFAGSAAPDSEHEANDLVYVVHGDPSDVETRIHILDGSGQSITEVSSGYAPEVAVSEATLTVLSGDELPELAMYEVDASGAMEVGKVAIPDRLPPIGASDGIVHWNDWIFYDRLGGSQDPGGQRYFELLAIEANELKRGDARARVDDAVVCGGPGLVAGEDHLMAICRHTNELSVFGLPELDARGTFTIPDSPRAESNRQAPRGAGGPFSDAPQDEQFEATQEDLVGLAQTAVAIPGGDIYIITSDGHVWSVGDELEAAGRIDLPDDSRVVPQSVAYSSGRLIVGLGRTAFGLPADQLAVIDAKTLAFESTIELGGPSFYAVNPTGTVAYTATWTDDTATDAVLAAYGLDDGERLWSEKLGFRPAVLAAGTLR